MQTVEPLRERQRVDTWRTIHEAAATLALEVGLAEATVESIADRAGVSRRTFFNYFATKEDAVLGLENPEVPREAHEEFLAGGTDTLGDMVRLMTATVRSAARLHPDPERRRALVARFPELRLRLDQHANAAEGLVAPLLADRLSVGAAEETHTDEVSAKALLMLASTVMRFAYWHDADVSGGNGAAVDAAIETFRDIVRKALL